MLRVGVSQAQLPVQRALSSSFAATACNVSSVPVWRPLFGEDSLLVPPSVEVLALSEHIGSLIRVPARWKA